MTGNRPSRIVVAAVCAAAFVLIPGAAWSNSSAQAELDVAEPSLDGVRNAVRVRYDDLDVSRDQGIRALYARLDTAARRACGHYDMRNLRERRSWRSCRATALADAVERIGLERLAELARTPRGRGIDPRISAETRASLR